MIAYDPEDDSKDEELASAITHGIAVVLSLIAIPLLVIHAQKTDPALVLGVSVFGVGLLMVYLSSTLYHTIWNPRARRALRTSDHISIFFLIAGTHTPIILKYVKPEVATIFLSIMWGIVIVGTLMKIFFTGRMKVFFLVLYLAMGWMSVFILKSMLTNMPLEIFWWVLGGGLAYTLGVTFFVWTKLKYHHAIWHCFVMAGTAAHFVAIYLSLGVTVHF